MSKIAFIYPGQGAQKCGMGADFYENSASVRKLFDEAGEQLGLDMHLFSIRQIPQSLSPCLSNFKYPAACCGVLSYHLSLLFL